MHSRSILLSLIVVTATYLGEPYLVAAQRITLCLDGNWSIAESVEPDKVPSRFDHVVAVPGLINQSKPPFPDVDQYETHEYNWTLRLYQVIPQSEKFEGLGRTRQKRNYFWYRRMFAHRPDGSRPN